MKYFALLILMFVHFTLFAQRKDVSGVMAKIDFATTLINEQPNSEEMFASDDYTVYAVDEFEFTLEDKSGNFYTTHLHIETLEIVYVSFQLPKESANEVYAFLAKKIQVEYTASQHLWNYYRTKNESFSICDAFEDRVEVHVTELYTEN
ncbi:MAG: hypothetical protein ACPG4Z_08390 [Chitinophagales bacterium]